MSNIDIGTTELGYLQHPGWEGYLCVVADVATIHSITLLPYDNVSSTIFESTPL